MGGGRSRVNTNEWDCAEQPMRGKGGSMGSVARVDQAGGYNTT